VPAPTKCELVIDVKIVKASTSGRWHKVLSRTDEIIE
jgi:hypothetical protein